VRQHFTRDAAAFRGMCTAGCRSSGIWMCSVVRRSQEVGLMAHESRIGLEMLAEVYLTGLFSFLLVLP